MVLHFISGKEKLVRASEPRFRAALCLKELGKGSCKAAGAGWVLAQRERGLQGPEGNLSDTKASWAGELGHRDSAWTQPCW